MTQELAGKSRGELSEHDGALVRRAFWLTATDGDREQHEFYGYAAIPGALACVTCIYDDAADQTWAESVWRSARPAAGG